MKIKLKGKIISLGKNRDRLKRIANICNNLKSRQSGYKLQWMELVIGIVTKKLKKVDSESYETVH